MSLDLLRRLYVAGVDVEPNESGGIRVSRNEPPAELVAELKANRDDVVHLLAEHHIGQRDDGLDSRLCRRYVTPPDCLAPRVCARLGPCSRFLTLQPCNTNKGR